MSRSGAASDLAKGKNFTEQLLYVQHVDEEKDTASTISEQSLHEYFLGDSQIFSDSNFAEYLRNPEANVDILKSSLQDEIVKVAMVYTNPLPATPTTAVTIHAFVVLVTQNFKTNNWMCYSMEKNGQYIALQQSPNQDDVIFKLYDPEKEKLVKRLGPVKEGNVVRGNGKELEYLIRAIWKTNQLTTKYHLLFSNCQNFAEFVFKEASFGGKKWSTWISSIVDRIGLSNKKSQTEIQANTLKYHGRKDAKFVYYEAMAEGNKKKFEELAKNNLTTEMVNSVDSQGYTLLEWATVFSTSNWPIDQFIKGKGAEIQTDDEGKFRRNVFFIALQYLPSKKESRYLSFDGIDIHGVNSTGDSALHLALSGEKWDVAERILDQFPDYDVNATNTLGYTPLYLAVHPKCEMVLIKKILARTNSESVNAQDEDGWTALLYAMSSDSKISVKELLKRDDVDVNVKNNNNGTALHYACSWKNIPIDLFRVILEKSANVNAQDMNGDTALYYAISNKYKTAVEELLKRMDVDVNLKDNNDRTALHFACCWWKNIPVDLFRVILEKSTNVNAQDKYGETTLHWAIEQEIRTAVEELLKHKDVDLNLKDNDYCTALHCASEWKNIPVNLFKIILEKSTDVNAQTKIGSTALHLAIVHENRTAVEELLKRKDVDLNLKNNDGRTALHCASEWKNIPVNLFKLILEKSTDVVNAQDIIHGYTALHLAIFRVSATATKQLLEHNDVDVNLKKENKRTALHLALIYKTPIDLFRVILGKSADINAQDEDGETALHFAIIEENKIAVEELLKRRDVDVNLKKNNNEIALHYACCWKDLPINLFTRILEKSTDVNAQNEYGNTALHWAIALENRTAVEELLKRDDVNVNLKNNYNQTALNLCSAWKGIPANLLKIINDKTTAENKAETENEAT